MEPFFESVKFSTFDDLPDPPTAANLRARANSIDADLSLIPNDATLTVNINAHGFSHGIKEQMHTVFLTFDRIFIP